MRAAYMTFRVEIEALSDSLMSLDHEELISLIKSIDSQVADYDFTKALRDHFVAEIRSEDANQ